MLDANPDISIPAAAAALNVTENAPAAASGEQPASDEDARLIAAWRMGDRDVMETLYRRHAERVWRYARYFSGREDAAAEILQETFLRVIRYLPGFEGRSRFGTWLFTLARSAALEYQRARRTGAVGEITVDGMFDNHPAPDGSAGSSGADPADQAEASERRVQVRAAVARLPEAERESIVLLELEGMSVQEASEVLGWSAAKTKVTVFRARRRLRELLQPLLHPPDSA